MFTRTKKTAITKNYYNINSPTNYQNNTDYLINREENYYFQKRTTKIQSYSIQEKESNENPFENDIGYNRQNSNYIYSKSSDKKQKNNINNKNYYKNNTKLKLPKNPNALKKNLIFANNVDYNNNKNTNNSKFINSNIDLIKKKKELEEKRERERKIMEWFYINDINLSKRDMYDALATLIQSFFRGWIFRRRIIYTFYQNDLENKKKGLIYLNRIFLRLIKKNLDFFFSQVKNRKNNKRNKYRNSEDNKEKEKMYEEIKELIKQNNELQKKLGNILTQNKNLKNETEKYKEYKTKYKEIFEQKEKIYSVNNNLIEENQNLKNKLNQLTTNNEEKRMKNAFIIDKLKSFNYIKADNKKDIKKNDHLEIIKENDININSYDNKSKNEDIENKLNIYKNKLKNKILIKYIIKNNNINNNILKKIFFDYKNKVNVIKLKEQDEEIKKIINELEKLKKNINENNNNQEKEIKLNKLKSLFRFKSSINKNNLYKYFLSYYYKVLSIKNKIQIENLSSTQNIQIPKPNEVLNSITSTSYVSEPVCITQTDNNNNEESNNIQVNNNINKEEEEKEKEKKEKEEKEKKEKEEKEKKARIIKARNLRKLLTRKYHEKKDNLRKYFYKYVHISMMSKIRAKLLEMKRKQIEKSIKEEKKENAKYRLIQLQRDKQQRIASIFNKLDKKISQIKRTVIEAWNVKAKVMSIKTILNPIKNKTKKKKKKSKKKVEDNNKEERENEVIVKEKN